MRVEVSRRRVREVGRRRGRQQLLRRLLLLGRRLLLLLWLLLTIDFCDAALNGMRNYCKFVSTRISAQKVT